VPLSSGDGISPANVTQVGATADDTNAPEIVEPIAPTYVPDTVVPLTLPDVPVIVPVKIQDERIGNHWGPVEVAVAAGGIASKDEQGLSNDLWSDVGVLFPVMNIPDDAAGPLVSETSERATAFPGLRKTATLAFTAFMLPVVIPKGIGVRMAPQQTPRLNDRIPSENKFAGPTPVNDGP
jgi:hypothetical protein